MSAPKITPASQIKPRRQRWLAKLDGCGILPLQTGTAVAGRGGVGKSTFILDIIARLSRGELEGDLHGQKHASIIFGPEDDWATMMVPRLTAAGADTNLVYRVAAEDVVNEITMERELKFPVDVEMLRYVLAETRAKLIMIDPAPALMDGDMNKLQDVRRAYGPLMALAQENDAAIVLVSHTNKGAGRAADKMSGSTAWRDMVRSYLVFAQEEGAEEVVVTQDKSNYGAAGSSWKFVLEDTLVPLEGDDTTQVARVRHLGGSEVSVDDIYAREAGGLGGEDDEDRNAAQDFVIDYIQGCDDWEAKAADVIKAGTAAGFSKDEIKNARKRCKSPRVASAKSAFGAGWVWCIEEVSDPEGVTKVSKVSLPVSTTPSTPSGDPVTPSTTPCQLHGTDHDPEACHTCAELAGTPWVSTIDITTSRERTAS